MNSGLTPKRSKKVKAGKLGQTAEKSTTTAAFCFCCEGSFQAKIARFSSSKNQRPFTIYAFILVSKLLRIHSLMYYKKKKRNRREMVQL